ncbi:MAG: hypothetical protein VX820_05090 [Candidatus Neomarinimicrobiota bacterium]|nr:hypothetical protein [Candidatus Neomarinimicrobiota bacterium]
MNNKTIIAWVDDIETSARLLKLVADNFYDIEFLNELELVKRVDARVLVVDLNCINEFDLQSLMKYKKNNFFILLGFIKELSADLINYHTSLGCDIVLQRKEFLNNINSIVKKAFHAC